MNLLKLHVDLFLAHLVFQLPDVASACVSIPFPPTPLCEVCWPVCVCVCVCVRACCMLIQLVGFCHKTQAVMFGLVQDVLNNTGSGTGIIILKYLVTLVIYVIKLI